MTKAELKKQENKKRSDFIREAVRIAGQAVLTHAEDSEKKTEYRLRVVGKNRYFNFHRYGTAFGIQIYRSGDVDVTLKEMFHEDLKIRIVEYEQAKDDINQTIEDLRLDLEQLIYDFIFSDWHILMDYMSEYKQGDNWRELYRHYRSDSPNWKGKAPDDANVHVTKGHME